MKPYAYVTDDPFDRVDWSKVCRECWQFPNRCDHVAQRVIRLIVVQ